MLWVPKRTVSDGSFEHPKHMFKLMCKVIITVLAHKMSLSGPMYKAHIAVATFFKND